MNIPSAQLQAFLSVAQQNSFSLAAKDLHITQSALSQRVIALEEQLGFSLFVRLSQGLRLTEQGERLLRYAQTVSSLEEEVLTDLNAATGKNSTGAFTGTLRLGAYSSVFRSAVLPSLAKFLREYPQVSCEFVCAKMQDLPGKLASSELDFIIMDEQWQKSEIISHHLGNEKFVVISGKEHKGPEDVFLDNDKDDRATEIFFTQHKTKKIKFKRYFFDDCYGIIDGVKAGLGRAVMSEHLIKSDKKIQILKSFQEVNVPVYLHYYRQPFYTQLQQKLVKEITTGLGQFL